MIVVISDLHIQHTAHDGVRWEDSGKVLETKVLRNVGGEALSLLFSEIADNADRTDAVSVQLVFAGDIFELHRTPLWLLAGETLRPTFHPASESPLLEAKVHRILDAIVAENTGFFDVLGKFVRSGTIVHRGEAQTLADVAVIPHYIPGNHDRLVSAFSSTRKRVRELLCIPPPPGGIDAPFDRALEWNTKEGYGVRVRHGHEYDPPNISRTLDPTSPLTEEMYLAPSLGDFVTVDIATRLAVAFRAHYARELRQAGPAGDRFRSIYTAVTEFDDVRPQTMLVHYLTDAVGASDDETFSILRPVLRDAFETATADSFFVAEANRLDLGKYFQGPFAKLIHAALENLTGNEVNELLAVIDKFRRESSSGGPAEMAKKELGLATREVSIIVAGHTHEPDHVALPGSAYFLDSGTWRTRIDSGVGGAFGRLRGYTMVFCYHDDELRTGERRRFETWTGHLEAEDYGPMVALDVTPTPRPAKTAARFLECRVQHVDEGETFDGAELVLYFGIDGVGQKASFQHVHDGDVLTLPATATVPVDPALDGEVWCYGIEQDLGDSIIDRDDPMPWATTFLTRIREDRAASFSAGKVELRAADNRGNAFTLVLEIPAAT